MIVKVNTTKIGSLKELKAALKDQASVLLTIRRGTTTVSDTVALIDRVTRWGPKAPPQSLDRRTGALPGQRPRL